MVFYARQCKCKRVNIQLIAAYCIWGVISSISNLNRCSSSIRLFCHVSFKRDQGDWDWRWRLNDTPSAIGCTINVHPITIGCLIFVGRFPPKSPIIIGSFARNDLQLKTFYASSPPCTACCIRSVISAFSDVNRWSRSLGLFDHVPLKRDQGDWD